MADKKLPKLKHVFGAVKGKLVRFSYLNVHEARLNSESGRMELSLAILIPKENVEDVKAVQDFVASVKKAVWLDEKKPVPPKFWNPLRDGDNDVKNDGRPYGPEAKGCYILNAKTDEDSPPNVVGTVRGADGKFVPLGPKEIKSGDWGRVSVNLSAYIKGTGGVGAYLSSVQLVKQGEPLGSQSSAEDDFGDFDDDDDMLD